MFSLYKLNKQGDNIQHWHTSWNQDYKGNINLRYADDDTLMAESEEGLKRLLTRVEEESEKKLKNILMQVKEESEKAGLKVNIKKN